MSREEPAAIKDQSLQFALQRGLGRTVLLLEAGGRNRKADRAVILNACQHDQRYDQQCEDCRASYLFDVLHATGEPNWYADRICETLLIPEPDTDFAWHQLSELAARFVRMGRTDLRSAIYQRLARNLADGGDAGATTVIRLDGTRGYYFVLQHTAHLPPLENDDAEWFLAEFIDCVGESAAKRFSERWIVQSPTVVGPHLTYAWAERDCLIAKRETWKAHPESARGRTPLDYDSLSAWVNAPNDRAAARFSPPMGKHLDATVAKRLAADLLAETEPARQIRFLRLFAERAFPLEIEPLLPLVRRSDDEKLAWYALRALRNICAPAVRALGLELIQTADRAHWGPMLLIRNPGAGDHALFHSLLRRPFGDAEIHRIGFDLYDYLEINPSPFTLDCLLQLYERGPCSMCRTHVIEMLHAHGELPDRVRRECLYDASASTRSLAATR